MTAGALAVAGGAASASRSEKAASNSSSAAGAGGGGARVHPERKADTLTPPETTRIHAAIGSVLAEAILAEGSSFDAGYKTVWGGEGGFLNQNAMYGRGGKPCPGCSGPVHKVKIAGLIGRPTHYCPTCQVLDGGTTTVVVAAPTASPPPPPRVVAPPDRRRRGKG